VGDPANPCGELGGKEGTYERETKSVKYGLTARKEQA